MAPFLSLHRRGSVEGVRARRRPMRHSIFSRDVTVELPPVADDALLAKWTQHPRRPRRVLKQLEALRERGEIGSSLQAEVDRIAAAERHDAAGVARRRPALRAHHLRASRDRRAGRAERADRRRRPAPHDQVRALLALARRRRRATRSIRRSAAAASSNLFGAGEPRTHGLMAAPVRGRLTAARMCRGWHRRWS